MHGHQGLGICRETRRFYFNMSRFGHRVGRSFSEQAPLFVVNGGCCRRKLGLEVPFGREFRFGLGFDRDQSLDRRAWFSLDMRHAVYSRRHDAHAHPALYGRIQR